MSKTIKDAYENMIATADRCIVKLDIISDSMKKHNKQMRKAIIVGGAVCTTIIISIALVIVLGATQ